MLSPPVGIIAYGTWVYEIQFADIEIGHRSSYGPDVPFEFRCNEDYADIRHHLSVIVAEIYSHRSLSILISMDSDLG